MKKQISYGLFFIIASATSIIAMDETHSYQVMPLKPSGQRLLESDKIKRELCKNYQHNVQLYELSKTHHSPTFKQMCEENYNASVQAYRETKEFKDYQEQVKQIKNYREKQNNTSKVQQPDISELKKGLKPQASYWGEENTRYLLYLQLTQIQDRRTSKYLSPATIKAENPKTDIAESFPNDKPSPHYKKAKFVWDKAVGWQINKQCQKESKYYNTVENVAFHDALYNLQTLKHIMEYKWKQQSFWHRLLYTPAYNKQMAAIQHEIDAFEKEENRNAFTRSHIPKKYYQNLLHARYEYTLDQKDIAARKEQRNNE